MAFNDTKFLKTRMSEAVQSVLIGDYERRYTAEELIQSLAEAGWKVSVRYRFDDGSWIFSATTTSDHKHPDYCISLWSGSFEGASLKVEALLSLLKDYGDNPRAIEQVIRETEDEVNILVKEHLSKLRLGTS